MLKRAHVRQFLALVDAGNFTQAALRLRVTQPTLSAGIADLERLLGQALFVRDRRGVRLTEAGGGFLPIARDLEHRFRLADGFGRQAAASRSRLRLGTIRTVCGAMLGAIVTALAARHEVELVEGSDYDLRAELAQGRLDCALTLLREGEEGATVRPLLTERYRMWAHAGHPLAGREAVAPAELAAEVMIARRACEALTVTSRFFTRHGVRPRFALRSESDERCLAMVAAGLGITTAPESLAIPGIAAIDVAGYALARRLGLVVAPGGAEAGALAAFLAEAPLLPGD